MQVNVWISSAAERDSGLYAQGKGMQGVRTVKPYSSYAFANDEA
jgi:hypothetical protein